MVAVKQAPLFSNNFPLNTTDLGENNEVKDAVADSVIGAAAGSLVTVTHARIEAGTSNERGKRKIETVTDFARNTTATDVATLKDEVMGKRRADFVMPKDKSGNGGPAFTRVG